MREVIYQTWIHKKVIDASKEQVPENYAELSKSTNCWSEPQSGFFHGWGFEIHEDAKSLASYSVALVEDVTTGIVHKVDPNKLRFVQPPETRTHKNDVGQDFQKLRFVIPCPECVGGKLTNGFPCERCNDKRFIELDYENYIPFPAAGKHKELEDKINDLIGEYKLGYNNMGEVGKAFFDAIKEANNNNTI